MAGFWAQADDVPKGVTPSKAAEHDVSYYEGLDAQAMLGDAYNSAAAWGPNAKATYAANPTLDGTDETAARAYQDANVARLQSIAAGGPGGTAAPAAYANLAAAGKANNAYAAGRAAPANIAMAARTAKNTNAAMGAQNESKIAALKAQEQLAAYAALNPALAGMRAQDFGVAAERAKLAAQTNLANAGFDQSTALANQDAYNRAQALRRQALGQQMGWDSGAFANKMGRRRIAAGDANWRSEFDLERQKRADARDAAYMNAGAAGVGYVANAYSEDPKKTSDRRQKTEIKNADAELKAMFDAAFGGE
jgi:hypothetical protein